jgi:hypothetical protein
MIVLEQVFAQAAPITDSDMIWHIVNLDCAPRRVRPFGGKTVYSVSKYNAVHIPHHQEGGIPELGHIDDHID